MCTSVLATRQVMVLSHRRAPIEERMPVHGCRSWPARPLIWLGRSAREQPEIDVRKAMYCFYRERGK